MVWKRLVGQPARLVAILLGLLFVVSTAYFAGLAWRLQARLTEVRQDIEHIARVQRLALKIQQTLLSHRGKPDGQAQQLRAVLREEILRIRQHRWHLHPSTGARLARLAGLLTTQPNPTGRRLITALDEIRATSAAEHVAQQQLLEEVRDDARRQFALGLGVVGVLLSLLLGTTILMRRRVFRPLADLRHLLRQLAAGDLRQVEIVDVHHELAPVLENYNHLVTRLAELEQEHASRTESLEQQVRQATEALLVQQLSLARAERMAAVVETSARLAHEVRNPLAGIAMAVSNLQRETSDPVRRDRLEPVIRELERLSRLVDGYLEEVRHDPEPAQRLSLAPLVDELLALLRYQVPEVVTLAHEIPVDLEAMLPVDRFRQALINLLLNAVDALGDRGGAVTVSVERSADSLRIDVSDTGPGFPKNLLETGIQPFRSERPGGTGLGLPLVDRFARDLGGMLHLSNLPGGGACARLELPVKA